MFSRRKAIDCLTHNWRLRGVGRAIRISGLQGAHENQCYDRYPEVIELIHEGIVLPRTVRELGRARVSVVQIIVDYLFYGKPQKGGFQCNRNLSEGDIPNWPQAYF